MGDEPADVEWVDTTTDPGPGSRTAIGEFVKLRATQVAESPVLRWNKKQPAGESSRKYAPVCSSGDRFR